MLFYKHNEISVNAQLDSGRQKTSADNMLAIFLHSTMLVDF